MPRSSCSDPRPMRANMAHCWDASLTETWAAGNVCQVLALLVCLESVWTHAEPLTEVGVSRQQCTMAHADDQHGRGQVLASSIRSGNCVAIDALLHAASGLACVRVKRLCSCRPV